MQKPSLAPNDEKGQTFVEFIFLMLVMIIMSFVMFQGFRTGIADRWSKLVQMIADPTTSDTSLPR